MQPRYWIGPAPTKCDIHHEALTDKFIDGKTQMGPWGNMCPACWAHYGVGRLGTGYGQEYTKQEDGRWLKTGG